MSIHIKAKPEDVADVILLPGDPLRARYIAQNFLENPICYNEVRAMYGYTGSYKGKRISVQGTGMGGPSASIYIHELIAEFQVKKLFRVGTCGAVQKDTRLEDVILAMSASTDSHVNKLRFGGMDYAPTASFSLLKKADKIATEKKIRTKIGSVLSSDTFHQDNPHFWKMWAEYGVLAVEMETAALYTVAAKFRANALSILTVSDCMHTDQHATSEQREKAFSNMIEIALEVALQT